MSGDSYRVLGGQLVRALRGRRSQRRLSHQLGFRSNVLYRWETGLREPSVSEVFALAAAVGVDVRRSLIELDGRLATGLPAQVRSPRFVSAFVQTLWQGSVVELARRLDMHPSALGRCLRGQVGLRLPRLLQILDVSVGRMLDFVAAFVDPDALPAARDAWKRLTLARRAAELAPLSEAVLALFETRGYREHRVHSSELVAAQLGIDVSTVETTVELLERIGWIRADGIYRVASRRDVDTRTLPPESFARLKRFWTEEIARRYDASTPPRSSYVVFSTSEDRLVRIVAILGRAYQQVREILREPEPEDEVTRAALVTTSIVALDGLGLDEVMARAGSQSAGATSPAR